jgi:hypothetical protein
VRQRPSTTCQRRRSWRQRQCGSASATRYQRCMCAHRGTGRATATPMQATDAPVQSIVAVAERLQQRGLEERASLERCTHMR